MREDCLGLDFSQEMQHYRRGGDNVGEMHCGRFEETAVLMESLSVGLI